MFIIVKKMEVDFFEDEEIEPTRFDTFEIDSSVFENEIEKEKISDLDKEIIDFMNNSTAFVITNRNIIDTTTKILSGEKVNYELLCGYDIEAFIVKNDTIQNFYQINSICGFAFLDFEGYLFDKKKFLEHLKTFDKIDAESIAFKYKTVYINSIPYPIKEVIKLNN